jgi:hypothetical protein
MSPSATRRVGRTRDPHPQSRTTIQRGTAATSKATRPDGTHCSATTTAPFPPTNRSPPTTAAARHWEDVGLGAPLPRAHAYSSVPARRNRTEAMSSGGSVSMAKRMARYVEPQIT